MGYGKGWGQRMDCSELMKVPPNLKNIETFTLSSQDPALPVCVPNLPRPFTKVLIRYQIRETKRLGQGQSITEKFTNKFCLE